MEITSIPSSVSSFKSNYDGFIGLQPYQSNNELYDKNPSVNLMKALRDNDIITNEVIMVYINEREHNSVVKFGGYDGSVIDGFLTIL